MQENDNVKIYFQLDANEWHNHAFETLWAAPIAEGYTILNTPFFVKEISYLDIVKANCEEDICNFEFVVKRGGHSTYRIMLDELTDDALFQSYWKNLEELGCSYEEHKQIRLFAVDIPPQTNVQEVYDLLTKGEDLGIWSFEEGFYAG